jgi:hypothetical protein
MRQVPEISLFVTALETPPASQRCAAPAWKGRVGVRESADLSPDASRVAGAAAGDLFALVQLVGAGLFAMLFGDSHARTLSRLRSRFCPFIGAKISSAPGANFSRSERANFWPRSGAKVFERRFYEDLA